ncbi:hypothetical protein Ciccas_001204 [Cichlidogyrus casuarinus]|uniref:Uncharacterized protein n=1 Tax=Cichlidogyrus casuarinus TaxID=1844966 RepID=A0ABD2QKZ0_9PLAT
MKLTVLLVTIIVMQVGIPGIQGAPPGAAPGGPPGGPPAARPPGMPGPPAGPGLRPPTPGPPPPAGAKPPGGGAAVDGSAEERILEGLRILVGILEDQERLRHRYTGGPIYPGELWPSATLYMNMRTPGPILVAFVPLVTLPVKPLFELSSLLLI